MTSNYLEVVLSKQFTKKQNLNNVLKTTRKGIDIPVNEVPSLVFTFSHVIELNSYICNWNVYRTNKLFFLIDLNVEC